MLPDIESMYDIMKIQARAGVFIQDSLMDCYISTSNKRLKAAILELCNQIGTNKTMEEAVDNFSRKFSNRHIDVLCIVLTQAQSSGKTVQILSDMNEQINQLRHQRAKKDEGKKEFNFETHTYDSEKNGKVNSDGTRAIKIEDKKDGKVKSSAKTKNAVKANGKA